jgi:hypothetical protein
MGWWILVNFIRQPMLKLKTHSGFHDLFLIYTLRAAAHCLLQAWSFSKHNSFTYGSQVVPWIGETWFYFYIWDSVRGTHYEAKRMPSSFLRVCHLTYIFNCEHLFARTYMIWHKVSCPHVSSTNNVNRLLLSSLDCFEFPRAYNMTQKTSLNNCPNNTN